MAGTKQKKVRKSPQQIAEERLGVATRLVEKLEVKKTKAQSDLEQATLALDHAVARRDFLAHDPALPHHEPAAADDCPECAAGKHANCTHEVPNPAEDQTANDTVRCPCEAREHDGQLDA